METGTASVHDWLPKSKPSRIAYDRFVASFGEDQFLLLSWENATLKDDRLGIVRDRLLVADSENGQRLFNEIETTATLLERLKSQPISLDDREARERLKGIAIGDKGTACIIIELSSAGVLASAKTIDLIVDVTRQVTNLPRGKIRLVGTLSDEVAVDRAADRSLRWLVPPSTVAAVLVAVLALRKVRECVVVFLLAGIGQILTTSIFYFTGGKFSSVLIVLPTLVFMLCLSSAIHLINYYHDVMEKPTEHAGTKALLLGLRPTLLASLTTVLGMSSLTISQLEPIRQFGAYAACCLLFATMLLLALFPNITRWVLSPSKRMRLSDSAGHSSRLIQRLRWLSGIVNRYAVTITISGVALLGLAVYGLTNLKTSTKLDRMFPGDSPTVQSMRWMEQNLGPIISIEVVLEFDRVDGNLVQRVQWIKDLEKQLRDLPEVSATLSAGTFLPSPPQESGFRGTTKRAVYSSRLREQLPVLQAQGWIASEDAVQRWRVTCKTSALQETEYDHYARVIGQQAHKALESLGDASTRPDRVEVTGLSPVIQEAQVMLLSDLGRSFLMAFVLITPVMMLICRSVIIGGLMMLPNVLPIALTFGAMGWFDVRLEIAGILTASIALGIAVDDTLHFVSWYFRARRNGLSAAEATMFGYERCAVAMFETTIICCSAMLPFLFADFLPTRNFAMLMIVMLTLAIVGDMLFLPALLAVHDRIFNRTDQLGN